MQEWLKTHYELIVDVCRNITINYNDLAHDIIIKLADYKQPAPDNELRYYIYRVAINQHRDNLKKPKCLELTIEPKLIENELEIDPYELFKRLMKLKEQDYFLGIALELYYFHEGNITDITRGMKEKTGSTICRQTLSKYIEEAKSKL